MERSVLIKGVQMSARAAGAAGIAFALASWAGLEYPSYAMIAAVVVTDLSPVHTRRLGLQRIVATVVGAVLGALISAALSPSPLTLVLAIAIAMLACVLLRVPEGAKVAGYLSGLVLLYYGAHPWHYAFFRVVETVLGIVVASAVSLVPKLLRAEDPAPPA